MTKKKIPPQKPEPRLAATVCLMIYIGTLF